MRENSGSIVVLTDLTSRSDAAVAWATSLAQNAGAELHVLHGMSLETAAGREALPDLPDLEPRIRLADRTARAQAARLGTAGRAPLISFESPAELLRTRAPRLDPAVVVLPPGWDWDPTGRQPAALSPAVLAAVAAPVLIVGEQPAPGHSEIVLITDSSFIGGLITTACDWWQHLRTVLQPGPEADTTDLCLWLLDEDPATESIELAGAALVVVPLPGGATANPAITYVLRKLLRRCSAPLLLLPEAVGLTAPPERRLATVEVGS